MAGDSLAVPDLTDDQDVLTAALAYASAGWFVLPVRRDTRHAGSVVGKGWDKQSSRDPGQIVAWFAGTDYGIALHVNRSGAIVLDIDKPDNFHHWNLLGDAKVQQTRPDTDPRRGHYVFSSPGGQYSNSSRGLGTGWGDVRASSNGVIVAAPGIGERRWVSSGPLAPCPDAILQKLQVGGGPAAEAVSVQAVREFVAAHSYGPTVRKQLAASWGERFERAVKAGESRHATMTSILPTVFSAARIGRVNAKIELNKLCGLFVRSVVGDVRGGVVVTPEAASEEFLGMCGWAMPQALNGK
ncbi:bifunctional DNA primase/polymerase [Mycobacterium sp. NPDC003449]